MVLRLVRLNGSTVEHAWPPKMTVISNDPVAAELLTSLPGATNYTGPIGGEPVGGVVNTGQIPPPEENETPVTAN